MIKFFVVLKISDKTNWLDMSCNDEVFTNSNTGFQTEGGFQLKQVEAFAAHLKRGMVIQRLDKKSVSHVPSRCPVGIHHRIRSNA